MTPEILRVTSDTTMLSILSPREIEVLQEVVSGLRNKEIAAKLNITERTVKVHRANIKRKLQADSVAELVLLAQRYGLKGPQIKQPIHILMNLRKIDRTLTSFVKLKLDFNQKRIVKAHQLIKEIIDYYDQNGRF